METKTSRLSNAVYFLKYGFKCSLGFLPSIDIIVKSEESHHRISPVAVEIAAICDSPDFSLGINTKSENKRDFSIGSRYDIFHA